ncbi:phosphate signaling complex PhoU family protein [Dietzia sp. 179-F 9C3 NHS]|uniref:phosphate signaling complex PhoU family protein n=1 Tax=Dietzia sp. 179-F 9C3 NHS TaxID=3374295 RepID=UPI003878FDF4
MRTVFRSKLDEFARDLSRFCELDRRIFDTATTALLSADEVAANEAIDALTEVEELRESCEAVAFEMLLLEAPVAGDLRQVVSGIYIVEHFTRMATLAGHVARRARLRHPDPAVPEALVPTVREMAERGADLAAKLQQVLAEEDVDLALSLHHDDDAVDDLHASLMRQLSAKDWPHGSVAAVDLALLARYYERFADHTVSVANRIVYLVTGQKPADGVLHEPEDGSIVE